MASPFVLNNHVLIASEMMQQRLKLNQENYETLKQLCYEERETCHRKVIDLVGREINVGSSPQLQAFLVGELGLPVKKKRGSNKPTTDENALREYRVRYPKHTEILNAIIAEKHIRKKIESYINFQLDEDGHIPYSASPAGTETNRWSFSKSPRSRGFNVQTAPKVIRVMVDAPQGRVFICPDLPQADARIVAWDAQCERLIELFLDPRIHFHLENCIRLFGLAREEVYGTDEHGIAWKDRDPRYVLGKSMGHAANYRMAAKRLAMELGCLAAEAQRLLDIYLFRLYPEIPRWHDTILSRIKRESGLRTPAPFNRFRTFYGAWAELLLRGKISTTSWNEACAHIPQSAVADIINVGMEKLWEAKDYARFHLHGHDSFLCSVPISCLGDACRAALDFLRVTLTIHDRPLTMVPEMSYGQNYGLLIPWKGEEHPDWDRLNTHATHALQPDKLRKALYGIF